MKRPESVNNILLGISLECECPDCDDKRELRNYIYSLERAIEGAVNELHNLYTKNQRVLEHLRGEHDSL